MRGSNYLRSFTVLVIVFILIVPSIVIFGQKAENKEAVLQRDMYVLGHVLDFEEAMVEQGLAYSLYQGCFDSLGRGGYSEIPGEKAYENGVALWYDNGDVSPGEEEFLEELEKETEKGLKFYTSAGYDYLVDVNAFIPKDYQVVLELLDGNMLKGKAFSNSLITVEKSYPDRGEKVKLMGSPFLERVFGYSCMDAFSMEGKRGRELGWGLGDLIVKEVNKWDKSGEAELEGKQDISDKKEMGGFVFMEKYGKTLEEVEGEIETVLGDGFGGILP